MVAAAASNPEIKARTEFYLHRVPEEFYDMSNDRCERVNLIAEPARQAEIDSLRNELLDLMKRTADPFAEAFAHRENKELVPAVVAKLKTQYGGGTDSR
jgi:N-sulfoglucosamine sulfohydrolase